jgi:1-piperideine-2-carboxylate/1-pyrroline-2-carboxylate reductase [NAD(P)H]
MQILNARQTAAALPYATLVPAIARAAQERAIGLISAPERMVVPIDSESVLLCMPALGADIGVTKLITVHGNNSRRGLPAIQGEVIVFNRASGERLALLDGPTVTARRTAAVSLLGIKHLLSGTPATALIIGAGVQAAAHVDALIDYFNVAEFWIATRELESAQRFCDAVHEQHPQVILHAITVDSLNWRLPDTALIIALTTSTIPIIPAIISPQTLAIGVGAFKPQMAEFPPALLNSRAIVVDDLAGARHEAGDLLQANIDWRKVAPLADLVSGKFKWVGPTPVLKTVGQASWDLAAARVALETLMRAPLSRLM